MKQIYSLLLSVLITFSCVLTVSADSLLVGYNYGEIDGSVVSKTGAKKNIDAAIMLTSEMLKPYVGCEITKLMVGFSTQSKTLPSTITAWVRVNDNSGDVAAKSVLAKVETGWNEIPLTQPYVITGEEDCIYLGYQFYQESAIKCISFGGKKNPNACYLGAETVLDDGSVQYKWNNIQATTTGSLCVRALIEGNVPKHNLVLSDIAASRNVVKLGDDIKITGTLTNNASVTAVKPLVRYSVNGQTVGVFESLSDLSYGESLSFQLSVPTTTLSEECTARVELSAEWADGSVDDYAVDNKASLEVEALKEVFYRKMVCEEGTGTWCGFCVRGYVGMKYMRQLHGDKFIGIGVHNGDEFVYEPYDKWMETQVTGYPSSIINRDGKKGNNAYDASLSDFEAALEAMDSIAVAKVSVEALLEGDILQMKSTTRFSAGFGHSVRTAFVVLEDGLEATQSNYYSGGRYGAMDGFENQPAACKVVMNDVARYISDPLGDEENLVANPTKGVDYEYGTSVDLTTIGTNKVQNKSNLSVVAILIDAVTGEILNGEITHNLNATAISDVVDGKSAPSVIGTYDLSGRRVNKAEKGIYIVNGKKVIR